MLKTAAPRAKIQGPIDWHTLRHTFGTLVKSQGADVTTTKELMRHASTRFPPRALCTDNAAMIASAARFGEQLAYPDYLALDAYASGERPR